MTKLTTGDKISLTISTTVLIIVYTGLIFFIFNRAGTVHEETKRKQELCFKTCYPIQVQICNDDLVACADKRILELKRK